MPRIYWPLFIACAFFASLPITAAILFGTLAGIFTLIGENCIFLAIAFVLPKWLP